MGGSAKPSAHTDALCMLMELSQIRDVLKAVIPSITENFDEIFLRIQQLYHVEAGIRLVSLHSSPLENEEIRRFLEQLHENLQNRNRA